MPSKERLSHWFAKSSQFGFWQVLSQGLQLIIGFAILRWLSYDDYAQFGLVLGFQNMLAQLIDLGFTGSILALVGRRVDEPEVVGRYMAAAARQRNRLLCISVPIMLFIFIWGCRSHGWPLSTMLLLYASIVAFLFCQGWVSVYSPPLMMHQRLACIYRPTLVVNVLRLAALKTLHFLGAISAAATCWVSVFVSGASAWLYRSSAQPLFRWPKGSNHEAEREMRRYLAPLVPGMLFHAFHGQIQLFLITIFGSSKSIAEVTALGRLGQLFVFISSFVSTLLVPFVARLPQERAAIRYIQVLSGLCMAVGLVCVVAFLFPAPLLWLLGGRYAGLHDEVSLSVLAAGLSTVSGAIYSFNNARKWVFHRTAVTSIGGLILIESFMIALMDLGSTRNIMIFAVVAAGYPILPFAYAAVHGSKLDSRESRTAAEKVKP